MDINCDLGEGVGNDSAIMKYLDSCNIACGGHTGDAASMRDTVVLAQTHDVKIGAHPSFEDPANFGRKEMQLPHELLKQQLLKQINSLNRICASLGISLHHVKAHGALYNLAASSLEMAGLLIEVMQELDQKLKLYVPFNSILEKMAPEKGVSIAVEVFADRNYNDDFSLVSRESPFAVIDDPEQVKSRVKRMIEKQCVTSINGLEKHVEFDTVCIHGDHLHAVETANLLYDLKKQIN